ncbi:MAG: hypothetical protein LBG52_03185 [Candidatus Peribacteria bacterium]|nr:hypothetical protein [Candidatus Peribacteria bacterium]
MPPKDLFPSIKHHMTEHYYGGKQRTKHYSPQQIRKMKENMRKIPKIQAKAEQYQKKEEQEADRILEQYFDSTL